MWWLRVLIECWSFKTDKPAKPARRFKWRCCPMNFVYSRIVHVFVVFICLPFCFALLFDLSFYHHRRRRHHHSIPFIRLFVVSLPCFHTHPMESMWLLLFHFSTSFVRFELFATIVVDSLFVVVFFPFYSFYLCWVVAIVVVITVAVVVMRNVCTVIRSTNTYTVIHRTAIKPYHVGSLWNERHTKRSHKGVRWHLKFPRLTVEDFFQSNWSLTLLLERL